MESNKVLHILLFHWKFLLKFIVITTLLIFLFLFLVYPVSYESMVTVLPPEKNSGVSGISSLLGNADLSDLISGGLSGANSQLFVEIIKSRSASEYVIKKNNLVHFFNAKDMNEAVDKLEKKIDIEVTKEGIIKLNVELSTGFFPLFFNDNNSVKKLSADVANSFVEALDSINRKKLSSKARNAREYIEEQIVKTKYSLDSVENSLMSFQKSNKTISLPEQVKNSIEAAAKIKSEIVKTEVELGIAQTNLRDSNKSLLSLQQKLQQLKEQYNKIEMGSPDYLVTFGEVPELGRTMASLMREAKIQNEVYLMLQQQYYKEKIQENRDLPTVEILDEAIPPKKASGPRLFFSSAVGGFLSFIFLSFVLVFSENKKIGLLKKYV